MLNIQKIFEAQDKFDRKVVEVHGLQGKNLTGDVTHAFYVEVSELANEIEYFKYWKKNKRNNKEKQHDEWADCIHFIASIGNKYGFSHDLPHNAFWVNYVGGQADKTYYELFDKIRENALDTHANYYCVFASLIAIGEKICMTYKDMEKAYFEKNQVNYDRLNSGY
ncbi:dUTP diphosphatase [Bacillus mycoides]|uniref:dUTP diphosphatase n=1 Tax=Bacillus mycoides TaxID=1405 RepID=UPI00259FF4AB|nr:dUTP diphosphatase [Bacillus mycoides]MDM5430878.1 dUTP diphosphatase [Bacillus mycoides]